MDSGSSQALAAAASLIRRGILRYHAPESSPAPDFPGDGIVFNGLADCVAQMVAICRVEPEDALAFGVPWPALRIGHESVVAPALPVVTKPGETAAADAVYSLRHTTISRESAGRPAPFLSWGHQVVAARGKKSPPFDLLWFGDSERYILRGSRLEISDLHSCLSLTATPVLLDRLLVRSHRVPANILDGRDSEAESTRPAEVQLYRHRDLFHGTDLADVGRFLTLRADGVPCACHGDQWTLRLATGHELTLRTSHREDGWTLDRLGGQWPYQALTLRCEGDWVGLHAELHPSLDPMAPGIRGRLAFDLLADLVAWGASG